MKKMVVFFSFLSLLSGCATITLTQHDFLYPNNGSRLNSAVAEGYKLTEISINRPDGTIAWGIHAHREDNSVTVMYFGGNQFSIKQNGAKILRALSNIGVNIVMFDHRGYGESTGTPSVENLRQDAIDNYDYVRKLIPGKLIIHGQSLGSFEAGAVASVRAVDGLVLESTATNIEEWTNVLVPWYARPFVRVNISSELKLLDNLKVVKKSAAPLLILVGKEDSQTPPWLSEKLFSNAASKKKYLFILDGAGHNNVPLHEKFSTIYKAFLDVI